MRAPCACCHVSNVEGNRRWVDAMQWPGQAAFAAAPLTDWAVDGSAAGKARAAEGLTFLQVFDAGHMVPMDQPAAALDMLSRFINNRPFDSGPLPLTPLQPAQQNEAEAAGVAATLEALWARLLGSVVRNAPALRLRRAAA